MKSKRLMRLFRQKNQKPYYLNKSRNRYRQEFADKVKGFERKLQFGVRGNKIGPEWVCVDLYDESESVDYHYDIQNLPFEDERFDCIVCNAILEHVREPELAIYEMHRILRPEGQLWVDTPFLQAYHAHPHDYWRCTLSGIRRWMEDFDEVAAGIFEGFSREAAIQFDIFHHELGIPPQRAVKKRNLLESYIGENEQRHGFSTSVYSGTYYWGEKPLDRQVADVKRRYMEYLKQRLLQK